MYVAYKRYETEIYLDTYTRIIASDKVAVLNAINMIGDNEIHHIVKYYQKTALNGIFFKEEKILLEHHKWLYRVYFYRNLDLDFFLFLNQVFQTSLKKYIDHLVYIEILEYYRYVEDQHEVLKAEASVKRYIVDNVAEATSYADLLLTGNTQKAYEICKSASSSLESFLSFYNDTVRNAMKHVGYMWENNTVSVAQEHISTHVLEDVIIKVIDDLPKREDNNVHVLLSSAPEELHGLAIKIASRLLDKLGFKVTHIGVNIPSYEIIDFIIKHKPDIAILSATLPMSIIDIALLIDKLVEQKTSFNNSFKIGIAGAAFDNISNSRELLDIDFHLREIKDITKLIENIN